MARLIVAVVAIATMTTSTAHAEDLGSESSLTGVIDNDSGHNPQAVDNDAATPVSAPDLTVVAPAAQLTGDYLRLAACESTLDPHAISRNGLYFGLFQFDRPTWASVGGLEFASRPDLAAVGDQLAAAQRLHARRGWAPWPVCSQRLGLR